VWERIFAVLAEDSDFEEVFIDSTVIRAHQHTAGAQKSEGPQAIGRSRGGLSTKIHALVEALGNLARWRLTPGQSAGKRKSGKKRKGNPYVRRILCEAANAAARTRSALAELFKSLLIRRGRKRAIFALAHKRLKIVFVLISRGDYYRDATVDYEALSVERNAPRWMRMRRKYGYISA